MRLRAISMLALAATLAGCYRYVPVQPEAVPAGEPVRVRLTQEEADRFADLRLREGRLLEGRLSGVGDGAITVETTVGVNDPQRGLRALMQLVDVPFSGMIELERRELDTARTAFLLAGGTAVLTAVVVGQLQGNSGRDDGPGGGTAESVRLPLFRFGLF